ncbi:hypothetical protein BC834DRAFT_569189 [Gloeopeniophorella convolvens]|nr:hypothetical protein BC834DRAFT_569189 [Gloeopeniophorella convolvens]
MLFSAFVFEWPCVWCQGAHGGSCLRRSMSYSCEGGTPLDSTSPHASTSAHGCLQCRQKETRDMAKGTVWSRYRDHAPNKQRMGLMDWSSRHLQETQKTARRHINYQ